jgi:hypothetical protein
VVLISSERAVHPAMPGSKDDRHTTPQMAPTRSQEGRIDRGILVQFASMI